MIGGCSGGGQRAFFIQTNCEIQFIMCFHTNYFIFSFFRNSTAVCVYSIGDILNVFKNSNFKGFTGKIPDHRPGTCVADSQRVPRDTLIFISRHPEMEQPINPIGGKPIIISKQHYFKKIVVDRIVGKAGLISHVLYLATENGKIQKVVEINESTFVISEIKVLSKPGPILSMFLDSQTVSGERAQNHPSCNKYPNHHHIYPLSTEEQH
uniref:Sema domain-containing protein n=1 Tax=Callorhinchus milii TaxID=7868 RepID=A0A4W3IJK5_CALMI